MIFGEELWVGLRSTFFLQIFLEFILWEGISKTGSLGAKLVINGLSQYLQVLGTACEKSMT